MLVTLIIVLIVVVLALYAVDQIPMQPPFNWLIRVLIILLAILFIVQRGGLS